MVELAAHITDKELIKAIHSVSDPEIPVLSVVDMGIIQSIKLKGEKVFIDIIPTYTGCPAMDTIAFDLKSAIDSIGYTAEINQVLSPAWTTDMISDEGRRKLEEYGIAAPLDQESDKAVLLDGQRLVVCTNCGSSNTKMVSQFGSTPCKALFKCEDCLEPFDYFKCLK